MNRFVVYLLISMTLIFFSCNDEVTNSQNINDISLSKGPQPGGSGANERIETIPGHAPELARHLLAILQPLRPPLGLDQGCDVVTVVHVNPRGEGTTYPRGRTHDRPSPARWPSGRSHPPPRCRTPWRCRRGCHATSPP